MSSRSSCARAVAEGGRRRGSRCRARAKYLATALGHSGAHSRTSSTNAQQMRFSLSSHPAPPPASSVPPASAPRRRDPDVRLGLVLDVSPPVVVAREADLLGAHGENG